MASGMLLMSTKLEPSFDTTPLSTWRLPSTSTSVVPRPRPRRLTLAVPYWPPALKASERNSEPAFTLSFSSTHRGCGAVALVPAVHPVPGAGGEPGQLPGGRCALHRPSARRARRHAPLRLRLQNL